jgi:hypothetical protein
MGAGGKDQGSKKDEVENDINEICEDVPPMPLMALNHVSRLCKSVKASVDFYVKVLGFVIIERPPLDFNGAWYARVKKVYSKFPTVSSFFSLNLVFFSLFTKQAL